MHEHVHTLLPGRLLTVWKVHPGLRLCSHCIMSKKMGMVALRSSASGTRVTSRMGPTIAGMNFILLGPEGARSPRQGTHIRARQ